jgi:hypothetical protein
MILKLFLFLIFSITSLSANYLDKLYFYQMQASIFLPYKIDSKTTIKEAYFIKEKERVNVFLKLTIDHLREDLIKIGAKPYIKKKQICSHPETIDMLKNNVVFNVSIFCKDSSSSNFVFSEKIDRNSCNL